MNRSIVGLVVIVIVLTGFKRSGVDRIMLRMESQSLQEGKATTIRADLFYEALDGKLTTIFKDPLNHIMVSNQHGELTVYNPGENTVFRRQSLEYSSENNLMFYFLHNKIQDLGLREMGFTLTRTSFDDNLMVTRWIPPASLARLFSHIELVHDDYMPIYAGYYNAQQQLIKKVFYSDYEVFPQIILPLTITEFNYLPDGDSIINRVRFSDVRINRRAESEWFDFEIPDDATIID